MLDLQRELDFALELAELADAFTLPRFENQDFALGWKDDRTEVTEADRGTETLLAQRILADRPDHALFGEEHGMQGATESEWCWVIDLTISPIHVLNTIGSIEDADDTTIA